ncbi:hypothetical protein B0I35DRAFT_60660 [Stachybotrys elegans]|uniref:C2H2-type domain-containing protein n=1 Tax=Stachybotrys elegans TaxID=80388 RepID=A0A8K0SN05_9HYPO|nr:hypothetical protein B0I35DRAFT_60660 [Stachybotrys elegans]
MSKGHLEIPGDVGIVARLHGACVESMRSILSDHRDHQEHVQSNLTSFKRVLQSLTLWGLDHSVADGTLDTELQKSKNLQNATLIPLRAMASILAFDLLPSISRKDQTTVAELRSELIVLLEESKIVIAEDEDSDEEIYSDDGASSSTISESNTNTRSFQVIVSRLTNFTRCLVDLSIALEHPAKDPEYLHEPEIAEKSAIWMPHQPYSQKIQEKFPLTPPDLVDYLGKSNLKRRQRIAKQHEMVEDVQESKEYSLPEPIEDANISILDRYRADAWWRRWLDSRLTETMDIESLFKDSGLGSSLPTASGPSQAAMSDVSSIASSLAEASWKAFPQLTEDAKRGRPFECDGCGRIIVVAKTKYWRKHLIKDLHPYDCILPDCHFSVESFPNQRSWRDHILLEHGEDSILKDQKCIFCGTVVSDGSVSLLKHISRHLEEISAAALSRHFDAGDSSDTISQSVSADDASESTASIANAAAADFYGYLLQPDNAPTPMFDALLRSIFDFLVRATPDPVTAEATVPVLSPHQLHRMYEMGKEASEVNISQRDEITTCIWMISGVQHALMPGNDDFAAPSIPCITRKGFVRWMTLNSLLDPGAHHSLLQHVVRDYRLLHPDTGQRFNEYLPRKCLPLESDEETNQLFQAYAEQLRAEAEGSRSRNFPYTNRQKPSSIESPEAAFEGSLDIRVVTAPTDVSRLGRTIGKSQIKSEPGFEQGRDFNIQVAPNEKS